MDQAKVPPFMAIDCAGLEWLHLERNGGEGIRFKVVFDGAPSTPRSSLIDYAPGWTEKRHRHAEEEILFLYEGQVTVGEDVYAAPSVLYIARGVLYGPLTAGAQGAKLYKVAYNAAATAAAPAIADHVAIRKA